MIYGIGTDIVKVSRFESWVNDPDKIKRFFNKDEIKDKGSLQANCEYYASRFAAKEAFAKALGTGFKGFELNEVCVLQNADGKPFLSLNEKAADLLKERCGNCYVHLSLSHEKEYAIAYVVIEQR